MRASRVYHPPESQKRFTYMSYLYRSTLYLEHGLSRFGYKTPLLYLRGTLKQVLSYISVHVGKSTLGVWGGYVRAHARERQIKIAAVTYTLLGYPHLLPSPLKGISALCSRTSGCFCR